MDLQQFHVWSDKWADDDRWQRAVSKLKEEGLVRAIGISINRWQPANVLRALETGLIDAVQVVYNVLDQNPEDELFPICQRQGHRRHRARAVRRRQPGRDADRRHHWPDGDFRNIYFRPRTCSPTLERIERAASRRARWHDDAGAGAAAYPSAPGGQHGHPRHAQAETRRGEHPARATAEPCLRP